MFPNNATPAILSAHKVVFSWCSHLSLFRLSQDLANNNNIIWFSYPSKQLSHAFYLPRQLVRGEDVSVCNVIESCVGKELGFPHGRHCNAPLRAIGHNFSHLSEKNHILESKRKLVQENGFKIYIHSFAAILGPQMPVWLGIFQLFSAIKISWNASVLDTDMRKTHDICFRTFPNRLD